MPIPSFEQIWWTASDLIKKHGWYSTPGSRKGKLNINGISRDHMVSISDAWLQNIDPFIIRHPANCQLMQHTLNQNKNVKSSITLEELLKRIDEFNILYPYATI